MKTPSTKVAAEVVAPIIVILGLFALTLIWNIVAAFAVLFIGVVLWLTRFIQKREPHEPGE